MIAAAVLGALLSGMTAAHGAERRLVPDTDRKTIVLDPGHGGVDRGAQGPDGTLEKDVALQITQMIAIRLRNSHRIILTRSDDYSLALAERTEVANHQGADLFLSIHTGGAFLHQRNGVTVFSYQEKRDQVPTLPVELPEPEEVGASGTSWNRVQLAHQDASKQLAMALYERLCDAPFEKRCRIESAPLMVLMGADMPAALVEVGYITNPRGENRLNDREGLAQIAAAISDGMVDFLSAQSGESTP